MTRRTNAKSLLLILGILLCTIQDYGAIIRQVHATQSGKLLTFNNIHVYNLTKMRTFIKEGRTQVDKLFRQDLFL